MTDSIGNVSEESNHYGGYSDFSEREGDDLKETVSNPSSNNSERVNNLSDSKKMEITMALRHGISGRTEEAKRGLLDALPSTPKKNILGGITAITKKIAPLPCQDCSLPFEGCLKAFKFSLYYAASKRIDAKNQWGFLRIICRSKGPNGPVKVDGFSS